MKGLFLGTIRAQNSLVQIAWAVQGCPDWVRYGLGTPQEVKAATEGYRSEMDVLGTFLNDCCVTSKGAMAKAKDFYEKYSKWCEETREHPISQKAFGTWLGERGFTPGRMPHSGVSIWQGIGLVTG